MFQNEKIIETKVCKHCFTSFEIINKDLEFYEKVSPVFVGKKFLIPTPNLCPDCRQQRRLTFRNERKLYKRKCDGTGKEIISIYSPDKPYKVYEQSYWWSDNWNPLDYGRDFDFSKSFFSQFEQLLNEIPQLGLLVANNLNSEYVNYSANVKNSYLIFASSQNEDSMYSRWIMNSKKIVDSNNCSKCENCYECIDCVNISSSNFCLGCVDCYNCFASYDLIGCSNCIGCSLLRNKNYCINNIEYSKEDYFKRKEEIIINKNLLEKTIKNGIHRSKYFLNNENCEGEYIINSKNIYYGFEVENSENCKYITNSLNLKNSQDIDFQAFDDSFAYESIGFENTYNLLFCYGVLNSNNLIYSYHCLNGNSNLFGCIGLRNKSYCILNKQYTKEEYENLVPKIIGHMINSQEWGEFFPSSISPFGYNETIAQEYFPISRDKALPYLYNWSDYEPPFPKVDKIITVEMYSNTSLLEDVNKVPDDILNRAIECEITKKPFRIIKQELDFYRKHNLPIPKRHPDQRHLDRMKLRNPRKLFDRKCDKCGKNIKTTYSPERPEIVYCEECYNREIY
ncbi:MAG: hypothetical protein PHE25_03205 [Candidatus Gracilibacteria bacterium]|nr:hypothetical protein [Candidatus Gracilibacteria bacterium]